MFGLGTSELIIILVIVLVVFGAGKLPKVMKDLGKGVKSFKDAMTEKDEVVDAVTPNKMVDVEVTTKKENT
ncbi:MAG: twin-arginine translocase TatA/TatE family subunit [Magnetococcales bacterium]|nr:twin-arginine translocase TatA/TatE family subunit [Magnetococcales bacterium]MBF0149225.1 twin-arginine translocase TatA/TatE family subunit [Magnetococcales bacterium]MBF0171991.1 twin-arginine translocase TatA/TatE family subunit [Magnetococcales bacterium]MBF0346627.1 twin-arginine translocase TatA/TatE family subunit [Magnetococcales bacterium]MBF0630573.1 twin-arginine translocase TatA/TatE family subunit [Magnetococcales bacterium]